MLLLLLALWSDSLAVRVGEVTVIAPPARRALAVSLAEQAQQPVDWPGLGRRVPPPFTLIVTADSAELVRFTRGRAPGWGAGVVLPGARTVLLRGDLPDLSRTLRHELGHLVLHAEFRGRVPLWFDEGYAAWASGELGRFESLELNLAVATGRVPTLTALDGMLRGSASTASLAYSLAASAVAEIDHRAPPGSLERLLASLSEGVGFDTALEAATGLNPGRFEAAWRAALRRRYGLITWLAAGGMWTVVALAVAALAWHRRERDRPRRAALDQGWVIPVLDQESDTGASAAAVPPVAGPSEPGAVDRGGPPQ